MSRGRCRRRADPAFVASGVHPGPPHSVPRGVTKAAGAGQVGGMTSIFEPTLILHIGCGLTAVVAGALPIFTRKGARLHRWSGRVFATLMGVLLVAA
jgi:hypothetical protein